MKAQAVPLQMRLRKKSYWPMRAEMAAGLCRGLTGWFLTGSAAAFKPLDPESGPSN
jgi:hypothetical protein